MRLTIFSLKKASPKFKEEVKDKMLSDNFS
jgi:hypothetical protein